MKNIRKEGEREAHDDKAINCNLFHWLSVFTVYTKMVTPVLV